jgi:hypothetical protein
MTPLDHFRFLGYIVLNNANNHVVNLMSKDNSHRVQIINNYITVSVTIGDDLCLKSQSYRYNDNIAPVIKKMLEIKQREEQ